VGRVGRAVAGLSVRRRWWCESFDSLDSRDSEENRLNLAPLLLDSMDSTENLSNDSLDSTENFLSLSADLARAKAQHDTTSRNTKAHFIVRSEEV
jgi:hypothetical protein